jgi:2-polyprenyl-3-methyl-5-hydroxy-6-metoxy-1,4-benzoquinol methylase
MENCTTITACLACGGNDLVLTLDLNTQPLANNFRDPGDTTDEIRYPLAINRCAHCNHLQLTHAVNPALIYTHYLYVSGTSETYLEYMDWYAKFVNEYTGQQFGSILDIGCNDGSQLTAFKNLGFETHGVDPAENLFPISSASHSVYCGFWGEDIVRRMHLRQKFDIITTQNAFAHILDPLAYLKLAGEQLHRGGKIFISTSQADMVLNGEFDTIYHEHISYYNAASMKALAERAGLHLIDVIKTPIHGTSYIFVLARTPANNHHVNNILAMEAAQGLNKAETYALWAEGVEDLLDSLRDKIFRHHNKGRKIVGYGAAAKGMTLLNASGIKLDAVIDDNPLKQGLVCPGNGIPVVGIEYLDTLAWNPPATVVFVPLAWNFYTEIKRKIQSRRDFHADKFMRYFPRITIE